MMDAFMNDPTEPRTSLLLPPSSFSYFIFTFLDRRKSANLWVIRPLCRVEAHTESAEGAGLIERYGEPPAAYIARRGRTFPFRTPSASPTARLVSYHRRRNGRNDFSRRVFVTRGRPLAPRALPSRPSDGDFRSSWWRGEVGFEVSASNKNLGQIGRIVQFILFTAMSAAERVKTFTFSSLKYLVPRLTRPRLMRLEDPLAANCFAARSCVRIRFHSPDSLRRNRIGVCI